MWKVIHTVPTTQYTLKNVISLYILIVYVTAQFCPAMGTLFWAAWDQETFTESDSDRHCAKYFGGGAIKEVDFKITTIEVCNIIEEGPDSHRGGQSRIQRKCINEYHWWVVIQCRSQVILGSLFPLLFRTEILNTQGLRPEKDVSASSISETRIECLWLPLPLPSPTPAYSALSCIWGRTRLWQSWDLMSDTPRMQLFYYWKVETLHLRGVEMNEFPLYL